MLTFVAATVPSPPRAVTITIVLLFESVLMFGLGPPGRGKGKGAPSSDALDKLRKDAAAAAAKRPPKGAGDGLSSAGAASKTMDAIASLGSPGGVLAMLKKAKPVSWELLLGLSLVVQKPKKKELSFKEKLALSLGGPR